MAAEDVCEVGFEEGMLWLPSHVLDEACDTKVRVLLLHRSCFSWFIVCEVVCCTRFLISWFFMSLPLYFERNFVR